jgi:hypothetical protein
VRWTITAVLLSSAAPVFGQSLDYDYFKSQVEPIFLAKRTGHTRCYVCHGERSNNAFRLEKITPGATFWSEEQSRRNFAMASRLVVPGKPEASLLLLHPLAPEAGGSAYHSGGRQFESRDDPAWQRIARWVRSAAVAK